MPTITTNTTITLAAGSVAIFMPGGDGRAVTPNGSYPLGRSDVHLGPYTTDQRIDVLHGYGSLTYTVDTDGELSSFVRYNRLTNTVTDPADVLAVRGVAAPLTALATICESYERNKERNPRTQSIRSVQLVADTIYANTAAAETAFPAAANNNKGAKVGVAGNYVIQVSNGTAYATPTVGVMGYLISGVSTAGYAAPVSTAPPGLLNANNPPANGGVQLMKPFRMYGGFPYGNNGQAINGYGLDNLRGQSGTARIRISTDEPEPIINGADNRGAYLANIDLHDGNGYYAIIDPSITTGTGGPLYLTNQAFTGNVGVGGLLDVKLDLSQLGGFGRRKRTLELRYASDMIVNSIRIKPVSSYFQPPPSPRIWWLSDSLGGTVREGSMKDAYVPCLQDFLGVPDICLDSESGSGFVNTNAGTARTHAQKLAYMLQIPQYANPDLICLLGTANDNDNPGITAATASAINVALAASSTAPVAVFGAGARVGLGEQVKSVTTENLMKAGVDQVGSSRVIWIPMMTDTPQWIRGTGTIDNPTGDGNADLMFRTADLIHWPVQGHLIAARDYYAPKLIAALRNYIG